MLPDTAPQEVLRTVAEREQDAWRLDEGSYDLDFLQREINGDEDEGRVVDTIVE